MEKFLTLEEFQNKFEIKVNYLHYFQLIAAIPLDLKRKALNSPVPDLLSESSEYFQFEDSTIFLTTFRCKIIIKCLLKDLILNPLQLGLGRNILQNFLIGATVLWIYI